LIARWQPGAMTGNYKRRACGNWAVAILMKIGEIDRCEAFFCKEEKWKIQDLTT
jgi:hypothetical protein